MENFFHEISSLLPDKPEFIDFRGLLQFEDCQLLGTSKDFILLSQTKKLACVYGQPEADLLKRAIPHNTQIDILALPDCRELLTKTFPEWHPETAILHEWQGAYATEIRTDVTTRLLSKTEIQQIYDLDEVMREEFLNEAENTEIGAVIVDDKPICFCYANFLTDNYWDVSIDTLPSYRLQGYAAACVKFMIEHHRERQPVWGALASNKPSLKLALKLGFKPVAKQVLLLNPSENTPIYLRSGL